MAIITSPTVTAAGRSVLDNLNNPVALYALTKLSHAPVAVRIERGTDGAQIDIGWTATGDLDLAAALAFVGAGGQGYVNTWYDQSGSGNNLIQSVRANMPQLVLNGATFQVGNKPGLVFNGAQGGMQALFAPMPTTDELCLLMAYRENWAGVGTGAFDLNGNAITRAFAHTPWSDNNIYFDIGDTSGNAANWRINAANPVAFGAPYIANFSHSRLDNTKTIKVNSTTIATGNRTNPSVAANRLAIGYTAAYGIGLAGFLSEVWLYARHPPAAEQARITTSIRARLNF